MALFAAVLRRKFYEKGCPECGTSFIDCEACAAVTCTACGCNFCCTCGHGMRAWSSSDVHDHARICVYGLTARPRREGNAEYFYSTEQARVASARRRLDGMLECVESHARTESGTPNYSVGDKLWLARWADHALLWNEGARCQSQGRWNLRLLSSLFRFRLRNTAVRLLHDRPKRDL